MTLPGECLSVSPLLGVSSLLKRWTCYDTPQVTIHSHPGAVVLGLPRPLRDVAHPCCAWPPSGSLPRNLSLYSMGQKAILSLDVPIISELPLFHKF